MKFSQKTEKPMIFFTAFSQVWLQCYTFKMVNLFNRPLRTRWPRPPSSSWPSCSSPPSSSSSSKVRSLEWHCLMWRCWHLNSIISMSDRFNWSGFSYKCVMSIGDVIFGLKTPACVNQTTIVLQYRQLLYRDVLVPRWKVIHQARLLSALCQTFSFAQ